MLRFEIVDVDRGYNLGAFEGYASASVKDDVDMSKIVYKEIEHPLYNMDQFALEPIMYCYIKNKMRQLLSESTALTVHYIPIFLGLIGLAKVSPETIALFQSGVSKINEIALREPGKIFLLPLSRIYRWYSVWPHQIVFPDNVILLSIERYMPNKNVICVPYPSNFYYISAQEIDAQWVAQTSVEKSRKACFFGRPRRDEHIRTQIIAKLEESKYTECVSSFQSEGRMHLLSESSVRSLANLRRRTWISVEPPGDSPSRKGIFDALMALSLPLLFESGRYDFPFSRFFPWEDICFFIYASDEWRLVNGRKTFDQLLSDISIEAILEKVSLLSRYVSYIQYTNPYNRTESTKDAFSTIEVEIEFLIRSRRRMAERPDFQTN